MTLTRLTINNRTVIVEKKESRMGRKNRKASKPRQITDPAERARKEAEQRLHPNTWGVSDDTLKQPGVVEDLQSLKNERRVLRYDCFRLLLSRAPASEREALAQTMIYVRLYQDDIAQFHKAAGSATDAPHVDGTRATPEPANIAAGERLRAVEEHMGPLTRKIMRTICENDIGTSGRTWRFMVQNATGAINHTEQGALVKRAMYETATAYQMLAYGEERKRA